MSRIAVVGGHGKVARLLLGELSRGGHSPVALVRREEHRRDLEPLGAEVRLLDIERKRTVDLEGSLKSVDGARQAGIRRFVQVSAIGVDEPVPEDTSPVWRAYVEAKRDADTALRASGLEWTVLRPGRLTDDPATGLVSLGDVSRGDVTRADVAAVLATVLDDQATIGHQWNLVGGDTPVRDAVAQLTRPS